MPNWMSFIHVVVEEYHWQREEESVCLQSIQQSGCYSYHNNYYNGFNIHNLHHMAANDHVVINYNER